MDLNVFEVLKEQRIKKDQENLLKAVVTTMPFIKEFYTGLKLIQKVNRYVKLETFKQN